MEGDLGGGVVAGTQGLAMAGEIITNKKGKIPSVNIIILTQSQKVTEV